MARETPVVDIMSTDVLTFTPEMSVEEAVTALTARGISGAPVVDDDGRLVGLLDDSDLILSESRIHAPTAIEILGAYIPLPASVDRFREDVRHALARTVGELMDDEPHAVHRDAIIEDVATIMTEREVSRVPVVDDDRHVLGIVSRGDLVRAMRRPGDGSSAAG